MNSIKNESRYFHRYEGAVHHPDWNERVGIFFHFFANVAFGKKIVLHSKHEASLRVSHLAVRILAGLAAILFFEICLIGRILISTSKSHRLTYEIYINTLKGRAQPKEIINSLIRPNHLVGIQIPQILINNLKPLPKLDQAMPKKQMTHPLFGEQFQRHVQNKLEKSGLKVPDPDQDDEKLSKDWKDEEETFNKNVIPLTQGKIATNPHLKSNDQPIPLLTTEENNSKNSNIGDTAKKIILARRKSIEPEEEED